MKASTFLKAGAIALFSLFLSTQVVLADAPNTILISGNTTNTENTTGKWMFNRDISTSTPFEFNSAAHSIGAGSLYVLPIGAIAVDKFVGEYFVNKPISDINSLSYDFKIAGNGDTADKDQFYVNIYANIDNSTNYYDCRFDYVPSTGSTVGFTTSTITPTTAPVNVRKRGTRITSCPTTLAGMPSGSHVRVFALNLGDTSTSDSGLAGYFDNVIVNIKKNRNSDDITIFDFEEKPKVTICHRTSSATNPYEIITVDADSADGDTQNDNGKGDHTEHIGPVAYTLAIAQALKDGHLDWGDIIPPHHNFVGFNWSTEGQEVYRNECAIPSPTPSPTPTPTPSPTPSPTPTPTPSPTPSPSPEVTPSPEPTPTPEVSPEPTPSPTPSPVVTPTPAPGKTSGLEITALSCSNRNFDVVIDLDDNNKPATGVKVKFTYNGKVVESTTDAEGKARAGFQYEGDMSVKVEPENGFAGHDRHVSLPTDLVCEPGVGGTPEGEVLGATTMAETGIVTDFLVKSMGSVGGMLTSIGSVLYAKKKRS